VLLILKTGFYLKNVILGVLKNKTWYKTGHVITRDFMVLEALLARQGGSELKNPFYFRNILSPVCLRDLIVSAEL